MSNYPSFFNHVESIVMYDELSQFLGAMEDGEITFSYLDIVKAAGHSCGTVAGAYLIAQHGLKTLFKDGLPQRGKIKVEFKKSPTDDNTGVMGCVLSNITGATTNYGFGGIPTGKYNRRELLFYSADIESDVRLTRLDTNKSVEITYTPSNLVNPMKILKSAIVPDATQEDIASFPQRFQEMVRKLLENGDKVISIN